MSFGRFLKTARGSELRFVNVNQNPTLCPVISSKSSQEGTSRKEQVAGTAVTFAMPRLQLFFFALAALLLSATQVSAYTDPFICLVNQARAAAGVGPVGWSAALQGVARQVAADMDRTKIVSHFGS